MITSDYKVEKNIFKRTISAFKIENREIKRYALIRFRFANTLILFVIFFLLITSNLLKESFGIFHLIKAFSEAAMVGALADWFAVVALFKYPLNLPIPHTAIIPKNKDRIAQSLADFVETHFLNENVISERITSSNPSEQLSKWLQNSEHREMITQNVKKILPEIFKIFQNQDFSNFIVSNLKENFKKVDLSGILSNILESLTKNNEHKKWVNIIISSVRKLVNENKTFIKNKVKDETPWWTFGLLNNKIYNKIIESINNFIEDLEKNNDNKFRNDIDNKIKDLIIKLKQDNTLINKIDDLKDQLIENEELTNYILSFINNLTEKLNIDLNDKNSVILELINSSLTNFANNLEHNKPVQHRINEFIKDVATKTISSNAGKISSIITETMGKWDNKEITEELEVQIGKDLQYIRLNGAIAGGIVGVVIYAIGVLI